MKRGISLFSDNQKFKMIYIDLLDKWEIDPTIHKWMDEYGDFKEPEKGDL